MTITLKDLADTEISQILHSHGSVFDPKDQISKALGFMKKTGRYEVVAANGNRIGIITLRDMLGVDQPEQTKIDSIWSQIGTASLKNTILEITDFLLNNNITAIPVVEKEKVVGIISQRDINIALCNVIGLQEKKAKEILLSPVVSIESNESIATVRRLMLDKGYSYVPVVDQKKLVGIINAEDLVNMFVSASDKTTRGDRSGKKTTRFSGFANKIMNVHPFTVDQNASIYDIVNGFKTLEQSACTMVNELNEIIGLITIREPLALINELKPESELPVYILGITDEDFFEKSVAEDKVRRIVNKSIKIHPNITEVSIRVKKQRQQGERTRYQLTARVLGSNISLNAKNEGWGLMETFDGICDVLDTNLRREKKVISKGPRRGRRRPNPNLKP